MTNRKGIYSGANGIYDWKLSSVYLRFRVNEEWMHYKEDLGFIHRSNFDKKIENKNLAENIEKLEIKVSNKVSDKIRIDTYNKKFWISIPIKIYFF